MFILAQVVFFPIWSIPFALKSEWDCYNSKLSIKRQYRRERLKRTGRSYQKKKKNPSNKKNPKTYLNRQKPRALFSFCLSTSHTILEYESAF